MARQPLFVATPLPTGCGPVATVTPRCWAAEAPLSSAPAALLVAIRDCQLEGNGRLVRDVAKFI